MRFELEGVLSALPVDGVAEFTLLTSQPGFRNGATMADAIPQPQLQQTIGYLAG